MNVMIVPVILVCSSFLISMCMFIVSKALLISSATMIVCAGGAIWLNPFAMVLFNVCSTITVECCVCTHVAWVWLVCLLLWKDEDSSPMSLQLLRGGIWAYMTYPRLCLFLEGGGGGRAWDFAMGTMLANFHMCGIMLMLRAVFNMLVRNARVLGA